MAGDLVLVVGGTGMLGGQVVQQLLARGKRVRALVRQTSDTASLRAAGVELVLGDLMDADSLPKALDGADAVVTSAAGYTRHTPGDTIETDHTGNRNLVDAAAASAVRRFVLTSILNCHEAPAVPHFWAKKLVEDHLRERGVPFVSLRPGAFVDYFGSWGGGDGFAAGRVTTIGDADVPMTWVYTPDMAGYLAAAVDTDVAGSELIDIGCDRPLSARALTDVAAQILGRHIEVVAMDPAQLRRPDMPDDAFRDFAAMFDFFRTGRYVADTRRQAEVFGAVPSAEHAVRRRLLTAAA